MLGANCVTPKKSIFRGELFERIRFFILKGKVFLC